MEGRVGIQKGDGLRLSNTIHIFVDVWQSWRNVHIYFVCRSLCIMIKIMLSPVDLSHYIAS